MALQSQQNAGITTQKSKGIQRTSNNGDRRVQRDTRGPHESEGKKSRRALQRAGKVPAQSGREDKQVNPLQNSP